MSRTDEQARLPWLGSWAEYERLLDAFENAWLSGRRPALEEYLPPAAECRKDVLVELVHTELELRLRAGEAARVEEYCARYPELAGEDRVVLGWLRTECALRQGRDPAPTPEEYRRRFPQHAFQMEPQPASPGPCDPVPGSVPAPASATAAGRYRPLRFHARGGLGEVFVVQDEELDRTVALKRIQGHCRDDADSRRRFLLEAAVTARLEHPGIVPVHTLAEDRDGRPAYVMRFIQGETLQAAIQRLHAADQPGRGPHERGLALRQLLNRFVSVCNTVAYAHSKGVLHRDLKPANILLGPYGETLVVDWGLARAWTGRESAPGGAPETLRAGGHGDGDTAVSGTPAFMSPEQAAGRGDLIGPACDVYGLGATLYVLLTGRLPFPGSCGSAVLEQVRRGAFAPPRQVHKAVPRALEAVCLKAMARVPESRYATALELAAEVERWLADEPVAAHREPWPVRLARWGRRRRLLVTGAAVLLVTLGLVSAVGLVLVQREQRQTQAALAAEAKRRQQTRAALDALASPVIEDWLAKQAELLPEQRAFLEKALASYEEFAADTGADEAARAGVAEAHRRVGLIRYKLGQTAEAEAAWARGRDLYTRLAADFPARPQYRHKLAGLEHNRGAALVDAGRWREAEAAYDAARTLSRQLAADFPAENAYLEQLAREHANLGVVYKNTGRWKDAEAAYREALRLQQQLIDRESAAPGYREELAVTHNNLGVLYKDLNRLADAETAYRAAVQLQQQLADRYPTRFGYRKELAQYYNNLGSLLRAAGQLADAEAAHRTALTLLQQLADRFPAAPAYRQVLARTYNNLGGLLEAAKRRPEAETAYRAAVALLQQLTTDFPAVPAHRRDLATSHTNLGGLYNDLGRPADAEAAYRAALALLRPLVADFPAVPVYRLTLARTHSLLGLLLAANSRSADAEAAYRAALPLLRQLAADSPAVPGYQHDLAATLVNLATLLRQRKDLPAVCELLEQALPHHQAALRAVPRQAAYRQFFRTNRKLLAETLVDLGEHVRAADAAAQLFDAAVEPAKDRSLAAGLLARCVPLAENDARLPETPRRALARAYGDRALAALRRAVEDGFTDVGRLEQDPAFVALRPREDFQQLMRDLESKP